MAARCELVAETGARGRLPALYDRLWSGAIGAIRAGKIKMDPVLMAGTPDERRGLTVVARPSPAVRGRVAGFLDELRRLEPDQYYYLRSELHLTVLSLFTATVEHGPFFELAGLYRAAVDSVVRRTGPLPIAFEGVTASPATVMIQGFVDEEALNGLRDALRQELRARGLGGGLDQRYRLESAHMTVARFRAPLRDSERFGLALTRARNRSFGASVIRNVSLVKNDWYLSHRATATLKRYRLFRTLWSPRSASARNA